MAYPSITTTFEGSGNRGLEVGHNSGYIETHIHAPAERAETPPSPSIFVPFRRDADFIDRGTLLDEIRERCSVPASRIALVGLGGVGKSQLAIEYCYRINDQSPETWVFWVYASNTARLEQGYREIADSVKLRGHKDAKADVFKLVYDWLRNEKNGPWLLVLDNADDTAVLSPPSSSIQGMQPDGGGGALRQHLSRYLPPSKHGSVLVTSRTMSAASQLVEESDIIFIKPMHDKAAHSLLYKKLGEDINKDNIAELAVALEYMPLALVQAAAYIRKRVPRYSVQQYLEEYYRSDKKKTSLLKQEAGHHRRHEEAKNSILITWQISFEHVRSTRQSAADLLSLMSFFDRQGIPAAVLRNRTERKSCFEDLEKDGREDKECNEHDGVKGDGASDECVLDDSVSDASIYNEFEDDILTLRDYSFISVTTDTDTFEIHNLVQLATRKWLKGQGQLDKWKEQYIANLNAEFPNGEYETWQKCQALFPHAVSSLAQKPKSEDSLQEWAQLLHKAAWYAFEKGRAHEAKPMLVMSLDVTTKLLGQKHANALSRMALLGLVMQLTGEWKEAEQLQLQVIEARKGELGERHPVTLISMDNIALTYWYQGRWKESELLQLQVIEAMKKELGESHPNTLGSMNNLALTYHDQGRWKEAEQLHVQVLEVIKELGKRDIDTLRSMSNLALTYYKQGRWKEAEQLQVEVMESRKTNLGDTHLDTLGSMNNLASTYLYQGRWKEAEQLQIQVMEARKKGLGENHPDTLTSISNLALTYQEQGRWKEAEQLQLQVIEAKKKELGESHPDMLRNINNLALTYHKQGRWKDAEQLQVQVIEARKNGLGENHPDTLWSMSNLASTYQEQGRWEESEQLQMQVMNARKEALGEKHPSTLISMENLTLTYHGHERGWGSKAEQLQLQLMEVRKKILGERHPDLLRGLNNLAFMYQEQGRWKEAEQLHAQVMDTRKERLGERHPDTLKSMSNLAFVQRLQGRKHDSLSLLKECYMLRHQVLGPEHPYTQSSLKYLEEWQTEDEFRRGECAIFDHA